MPKIDKEPLEDSSIPVPSSRIARQNLTVLTAIALIFAVGTSLLYLRVGADAATVPARPLPVEAVPAVFENSYSVEQRFAGRVEAQRDVLIAFERPGLVMDVLVEEGQRVVEGQVIAVMDTDGLRARRAQLEAERARVVAQLELARLTADRQQALSQEGFASKQRFDDARLTVTALEASAAAIDSSIRQIDIDLRKSSLSAPFDGRVGARFVDGGTVVNAGSAVVEVYETASLQARIGLPPQVGRSLGLGGRYSIIHGDNVLRAQLVSMRSDLDQRTQTVAALFRLTDLADLSFGEVVHFLYRQDVEARGMWLPLSALVEGEKGLWSVYVAADVNDEKRIRRESVEVIHVQDGQVYVRGTLKSGALVLIGGTNRVAPGQRITLMAGAS